MLTISLKREFVQEFYKIDRMIRPEISDFIATLAKEPIPKGAVMVDEEENLYQVVFLRHIILYSIAEDWVIISLIESPKK